MKISCCKLQLPFQSKEGLATFVGLPELQVLSTSENQVPESPFLRGTQPPTSVALRYSRSEVVSTHLNTFISRTAHKHEECSVSKAAAGAGLSIQLLPQQQSRLEHTALRLMFSNLLVELAGRCLQPQAKLVQMVWDRVGSSQTSSSVNRCEQARWDSRAGWRSHLCCWHCWVLLASFSSQPKDLSLLLAPLGSFQNPTLTINKLLFPKRTENKIP